MRRALSVGVLAALLAGCATQAARERAAQLAPGMTTVQVTAVLGSPLRTTRDAGRESWQYCWAGIVSDDYAVAWFEDALLTDWALEASYDFGTCSQQMDAFLWPEDRAPEAADEPAAEGS